MKMKAKVLTTQTPELPCRKDLPSGTLFQIVGAQESGGSWGIGLVVKHHDKVGHIWLNQHSAEVIFVDNSTFEDEEVVVLDKIELQGLSF